MDYPLSRQVTEAVAAVPCMTSATSVGPGYTPTLSCDLPGRSATEIEIPAQESGLAAIDRANTGMARFEPAGSFAHTRLDDLLRLPGCYFVYPVAADQVSIPIGLRPQVKCPQFPSKHLSK